MTNHGEVGVVVAWARGTPVPRALLHPGFAWVKCLSHRRRHRRPCCPNGPCGWRSSLRSEYTNQRNLWCISRWWLRRPLARLYWRIPASSSSLLANDRVLERNTQGREYSTLHLDSCLRCLSVWLHCVAHSISTLAGPIANYCAHGSLALAPTHENHGRWDLSWRTPVDRAILQTVISRVA